MRHGGLKVELVRGEAGLLAWEARWRALEASVPHGALFASFDHVHLAWRHFHGPHDALLLVALSEGNRLHALAPLRLQAERLHGVPIRVIEWVATWEGDRPGLLCAGDAALRHRCEARLAQWLAHEFTAWDVLRLHEQDAELPADSPLRACCEVRHEPDSIGFQIDLRGRWEDHLARLDAKVRSNWRNRHRKLMALLPAPHTQWVEAPADMAAAVDRFIALEALGWKADAGVGMGKDEAHRRFYQALTQTLAARGQARFAFYRQGDTDLAATLLLLHGDVVYERHVAFHPAHAALSPGIVLRAEIMPALFGGPWRTLDLMGMRAAVGRQRHKQDWASSQCETVRQTCTRRGGRLWALVLWRGLRARFKRLRASATTPA